MVNPCDSDEAPGIVGSCRPFCVLEGSYLKRCGSEPKGSCDIVARIKAAILVITYSPTQGTIITLLAWSRDPPSMNPYRVRLHGTRDPCCSPLHLGPVFPDNCSLQALCRPLSSSQHLSFLRGNCVKTCPNV